MTGYNTDPCPTCGEPLDDPEFQLEQWRDDARALRAVRVLDAWAGSDSIRPWACWQILGTGTASAPAVWRCRVADLTLWLNGKDFDDATPDAARQAAARAVFPELPVDVRAKIG